MNVPQTFEDLVAFAHAMAAVGQCTVGGAARVVLDTIAPDDYSENLWRALDVAMDPTYYNDWSADGLADLRPTIRRGREEYEAWVLSQPPTSLPQPLR